MFHQNYCVKINIGIFDLTMTLDDFNIFHYYPLVGWDCNHFGFNIRAIFNVSMAVREINQEKRNAVSNFAGQEKKLQVTL